MSTTLAQIPAADVAVMRPDERRAALAWNDLVAAASRRAGAPLRWTRQSRDWGELTIDWGGTRDTIYGRDEADALRRYVGSP